MNYELLASELIQSIKNQKPPLEPLNDISRGECGILIYLYSRDEGALSGDVSRALNLSTGRTAISLKSLEQKGLVTRLGDGGDRRRVRVFLTPDGRARADNLKERAFKFLVSLLERLGEDDAKEFVRLMKRTYDIVKG